LKTSISAVADIWRDTVTGKSSYDGTLQILVEQPRSTDLGRLRFLRWFAEQDRLERPVAGPVLTTIGRSGCDWDDGPPLAA
jgi:hypothetical protein